MNTRNRHRCKWEQQQARNNGYQRSAKDDGAFSPRESCACIFNPLEPWIRKPLSEPRQRERDCQGDEKDEGGAVHESPFLSDVCGTVRYRLQNQHPAGFSMILTRSENPDGTRICNACRPFRQNLFNFSFTSDTLVAQLVTFGFKERNRGPGFSVGSLSVGRRSTARRCALASRRTH
jgi:hypothetical protein